jgi:hypothetical protein
LNRCLFDCSQLYHIHYAPTARTLASVQCITLILTPQHDIYHRSHRRCPVSPFAQLVCLITSPSTWLRFPCIIPPHRRRLEVVRLIGSIVLVLLVLLLLLTPALTVADSTSQPSSRTRRVGPSDKSRRTMRNSENGLRLGKTPEPVRPDRAREIIPGEGNGSSGARITVSRGI